MKSKNPIELKGDDPLMNNVIDKIYEINADDEVQELIRLREKAKIDSMMALDYLKDEAKREGREKGLAEGRAEGLAEGRLEEKKSIAKSLKLANVAIDIIVSSTGLSREEIEKI